MDASHAVHPGLAELGRAGVGLSQAVLEVHQHLRVVLVLLHLFCGHQHCPDALCQVLHIGRKCSVLQWCNSNISKINIHSLVVSIHLIIYFWFVVLLCVELMQ